ncbi:uncharacterized protein LOC129771261 [Toxorhynchites rutilus septentrionalis]|uniref:uncharacterized protein LOC129771261 n=1 Tax=Toxorhynchites rutilus septentrionalis TaxID=329112 RepID=UPI002478FC48|nr:uncharacterized protein LOC129771261 [Toxorhynchites rutilus septentrionalis]XP_055630697.1 uncharacterized protein LOC129771261 [Toxorhynchites rutilus septentrionalis]XP_055630698.1 uncharacterized protein LOC129771261 [Toxorhynchites rutilus septentrionalis]
MDKPITKYTVQKIKHLEEFNKLFDDAKLNPKIKRLVKLKAIVHKELITSKIANNTHTSTRKTAVSLRTVGIDMNREPMITINRKMSRVMTVAAEKSKGKDGNVRAAQLCPCKGRRTGTAVAKLQSKLDNILSKAVASEVAQNGRTDDDKSGLTKREQTDAK